MTHRSRLFAALLVLVAVPAASAQTLKIGYADPEVIITYMPEYKGVQDRLATEYRTNQEALQAMADDLQDRAERYQKQQALLTPERRAEREKELADLQAELQQAAASKDQEMNQRQQELMAPLLEKVQGVIDQIAAEQGLDIVIRSPALLFVNEQKIANINLDIARRLGIQIDEGEGQ